MRLPCTGHRTLWWAREGNQCMAFECLEVVVQKQLKVKQRYVADRYSDVQVNAYKCKKLTKTNLRVNRNRIVLGLAVQRCGSGF